MNRWTIIPTSIDKLRVSHLDISAYQNLDHFFLAICPQYPNSMPCMVRRMEEYMKWQQYPSASMSPEGKSWNWKTDWRRDKRVDGGYSYVPLNLVQGKNVFRNENLKMSKKLLFVMLWPWPLTLDLEKLNRSWHYHYQSVYQIWE